MKWWDFIKIARKQPVIETSMLVKEAEELPKIRVQLSRWVKSGRLIQVKRGVYTLNEMHALQPVDWQYVATFVHRPSYISMHSALADYGMIPEHVPNITLITTKRPKIIELEKKQLIYQHVKRELFWGYETRGSRDMPIFFAEPEKAVLDLFYFTPLKISISFIEEMRFQNLELLNMIKFMEYVQRFKSPKITKAAKTFMKFFEQEKGWQDL